MNITEIIGKYTSGKYTLEEANEELKKCGSALRIDPEKNTITEEEKRATVIGYYPDQACGFGLLDTGTGTMDKVEVCNGQLIGCDCGEMYALYIIAGRTYHVQGRTLVE